MKTTKALLALLVASTLSQAAFAEGGKRWIVGFRPGAASAQQGRALSAAGLTEVDRIDELGLVVGEPVQFRFFASSTRKDPAGALIDGVDELAELDPVEKEIAADGDRQRGDVVPVTLEAEVTEVGTLALWCQARDGRGRWQLEYSVRERE